MKKFYIISNNFLNSVIQLTSNKSYAEIEPYLDQYSTEKLPNDVTFSVAKGEKWGEDPRVHTKGRVAVIAYTIITILMPFVLPFIIHPMFGK